MPTARGSARKEKQLGQRLRVALEALGEASDLPDGALETVQGVGSWLVETGRVEKNERIGARPTRCRQGRKADRRAGGISARKVWTAMERIEERARARLVEAEAARQRQLFGRAENSAGSAAAGARKEAAVAARLRAAVDALGEPCDACGGDGGERGADGALAHRNGACGGERFDGSSAARALESQEGGPPRGGHECRESMDGRGPGIGAGARAACWRCTRGARGGAGKRGGCGGRRRSAGGVQGGTGTTRGV